MNRNDLFKLTEKRLFRYTDNLNRIAKLKNDMKLLLGVF